METFKLPAPMNGFRYFTRDEGKEVAHAYLYIMRNDLHREPFGLLEDVFVEESHRGQGIGSELIKTIIEEARRLKCYKLIATSRFEREDVHKLYEQLGFLRHGLEFRLNLT